MLLDILKSIWLSSNRAASVVLRKKTLLILQCGDQHSYTQDPHPAPGSWASCSQGLAGQHSCSSPWGSRLPGKGHGHTAHGGQWPCGREPGGCGAEQSAASCAPPPPLPGAARPLGGAANAGALLPPSGRDGTAPAAGRNQGVNRRGLA